MNILLHKIREKNETIAATTLQTIDFSTLMPEFAIMLYTFVITGANNGMAGTGVDSYESKLGTGLHMQIKPDELRALLEVLYSRFGGAVPATTDLTWMLPWHLLAVLIPDEAVRTEKGEVIFPEVGLPSQTQKIFNMFLNAANSSAGTARLGYMKSYREPTHVPFLIGHAVTGLTASVDNQPYKLPWQALPTAGFIIKGFGATDFTRIRGYNKNADGQYEEIFDVERDHVLQLQQGDSANSVTDPAVILFGRTIIPRDMYFLINTGAGYAGDERFTPIQFVRTGGGIPGQPK